MKQQFNLLTEKYDLQILFPMDFLSDWLISLREKCPYTEFFLFRIFPHSDWVSLRIQSECEKIRTTKNSVIGPFSRSVCFPDNILLFVGYYNTNLFCIN